MEIKYNQGSGRITLKAEDDKPLILVVSRRTMNWQKEIAVISEGKNKLAVRQYQFGDQSYPMIGIKDRLDDEEKSIITKNLPQTAKAINLIFSGIDNFKDFKKIILVIHDQELFEKAGRYSYDVKQKLEVKMLSTSLKNCPDNPEDLSEYESYYQRFDYLTCTAFKECTTYSECKIELWSFMHDGSNIDDKALKLTEDSGVNVYDGLIKVLMPNFKKKLVDIKFRTLQLLLPLHIDFMGLSTCDKSKRTEYWDEIQKSFHNGICIKISAQLPSFIDGDETSGDVESISSFAEDDGFENDNTWAKLKKLVGKDSKVEEFFKKIDSLVKNGKSGADFIEVMEDFEFMPSEDNDTQEIIGYADWYTSVVSHFDELIAICQ